MLLTGHVWKKKKKKKSITEHWWFLIGQWKFITVRYLIWHRRLITRYKFILIHTSYCNSYILDYNHTALCDNKDDGFGETGCECVSRSVWVHRRLIGCFYVFLLTSGGSMTCQQSRNSGCLASLVSSNSLRPSAHTHPVPSLRGGSLL